MVMITLVNEMVMIFLMNEMVMITLVNEMVMITVMNEHVYIHVIPSRTCPLSEALLPIQLLSQRWPFQTHVRTTLWDLFFSKMQVQGTRDSFPL